MDVYSGCCGRNDITSKLNDDDYESFSVAYKKYKFKFKTNEDYGKFVLSNINEETKKEIDKLNGDIKSLEEKNKKRKESILDYENKIKKIDDKIGKMEKLLKIDSSEKKYIQGLGNKVREYQEKTSTYNKTDIKEIQ